MFSFFFFKQKTADELRISDWSSDVCSSDLKDAELHDQRREGLLPLLRLQRAWRCDPLDDRPARTVVHGRGEGTRRRGRDGGARARSARREEGRGAEIGRASWRGSECQYV